MNMQYINRIFQAVVGFSISNQFLTTQVQIHHPLRRRPSAMKPGSLSSIRDRHSPPPRAR